MKRLKNLFVCLSLAIAVISCNKGEEVWVDDSPIIQFKDPNFLKAFLHDRDAYDKNGDGQISEKEASIIKYLSVTYGGIHSMDEIKYFTAVEQLRCTGNHIDSLNLNQNPLITELYCDTNLIVSLDLSGNSALTKIKSNCNRLTLLDVTRCTEVTSLDCSSNQLSSVNLINNARLIDLDCSNNQFTSLDVSNNTALTSLNCNSNKLTTLDLRNNKKLTSLRCSNNQLTKIILPESHKLGTNFINDIKKEYGEIIEYVK